MKLVLLTAAALTIPVLAFAGGQPAKVRTLSPAEMSDRSGVTPTVQSGKGTGFLRNRTQTTFVADSGAYRANGGDSAFIK